MGIFGLNDMYGRPTKTSPEKKLCDSKGCPPGDQSNLEALLRWTAKNRPDAPIYGWELGNELNSCLNGDAGARTQAEDFKKLAKLRDEIWPEGQRPRLIGPDTHSAAEFQTDGQQWLKTFAAAAAGTVDVVTFHMYSMGNGPKLDPNDLDASFLNNAALDKSGQGGRTVANIVSQHAPKAQTWAGETAAANNGGQSGITNTYIDGFWYLDQLGSLAVNGVSVFQRQVLVAHGGYPLVQMFDTGNVAVLPDYWIALLHKRLMGQKVLGATSTSSSVRAYAHCAARGGGSVAFALLNIANKTVDVTFPGNKYGWEEWILTAGEPIPDAPNPLQSSNVLLNGDVLELGKGPTLPVLQGRVGNGTVHMPPTSYGFIVFPSAEQAACF